MSLAIIVDTDVIGLYSDRLWINGKGSIRNRHFIILVSSGGTFNCIGTSIFASGPCQIDTQTRNRITVNQSLIRITLQAQGWIGTVTISLPSIRGDKRNSPWCHGQCGRTKIGEVVISISLQGSLSSIAITNRVGATGLQILDGNLVAINVIDFKVILRQVKPGIVVTSDRPQVICYAGQLAVNTTILQTGVSNSWLGIDWINRQCR